MHPFEYLRQVTIESPAAIALSSSQTELTFAELFDSAIRFAQVFRARGVRPGHVVVVRAPTELDLVISQALLHEATVGGHVPAGLEKLIGSRIDWIVTDAPVPGVPTERQIVLDGQFFMAVAAVPEIAPADASPLPYANDDALCRISFSSGTTGEPKAIGWSVDCLMDRALDRRTQWMPVEPYLCLLGQATGLAFMTYFANIARGVSFLLPESGAELARQVAKHGVACIMASPHQLGNLLTVAIENPDAFESVTTIMSAGSVLPDFIAGQLERVCGAQIISTYASSEAGSVAIRPGLGSTEGYAGHLFDEVEVLILDESGTPLADGQIGEIGVRRARQPHSYLFGDDPTGSFRDGYFFSGDLGYLRGRDLYLAGRSTEIINAGGVKIDPAKVESYLRGLDGVRDAAVFSLFDKRGLEKLAVVFVSDAPLGLERIQAWLRPQFGEAVPQSFARVSEIPRSPMGKVNRSELRERFGAILQT